MKGYFNIVLVSESLLKRSVASLLNERLLQHCVDG